MSRSCVLLLSALLIIACRERPADREQETDRRRESRASRAASEELVIRQTIALTNQTALRLDLEYAAGRLDVEPAPSGVLAELDLTFSSEEHRPAIDFDSTSTSPTLWIHSPKRRNENVDLDRLRDNHWRLKLSPEIPITFDIEGGAFDAALDFDGLKVANLNLDVGAGELDIEFREPNPETPNLRINSGAASVEARGLCYANFRRFIFNGGAGKSALSFDGDYQGEGEVEMNFGVGVNSVELNRALGVRIRKEGSFLAPISLRDFVKQGDTYYSENYDTAKGKLDFYIKMGVGHTSIRWIK